MCTECLDKQKTCDLDSVCVTYKGRLLRHINVDCGNNLDYILKQIDMLLGDLSFKVTNGFVGVNSGNGVHIYKGTNMSGTEEFKTLKVSNGIKVSDSNDTISFSIDENYVNRIVEDNVNKIISRYDVR